MEPEGAIFHEDRQHPSTLAKTGFNLMARLSAADWVALGLMALAEDGEAGLTIESLTARAGKTRGSFYHHFATHDGFLDAIAARWVDDNRAALIAAAQTFTMNDRTARIRSTIADPRLEQAARSIAATRPSFARAVAQVDAARIAYLRSLQADPASGMAADYAMIEYAVFIGLQAILPATPTDRSDRIGRLTADMIAVHWNE